ncbi:MULTISPECIES: hypothetical protein [Escherichia]|uniref:hypothetical protein n=1 Tax=Escherichia TaxID=561 RepID=UPI000D1668A0|nr:MULTISPECIES: hypothetical protein [Escherichia]MBY7471217.1 hypothetical protein [Escherichia marmotae]MDQ9283859.1 hypothetical protein [Escherichia marmotae]MED0632965.1 hypothetical protein [Escherichia marmotae]MED8892545.1 hypothetical protein [Escherichia marmotae]MED9513527.1 hypothetical protein [Escherichia marmotae]
MMSSGAVKRARFNNPDKIPSFFKSSLYVPGIGHSTESEVFFGTEEQYVQFKAGENNVALAAVN